MIVTLIYKNGRQIEKEVPRRANRLYGGKLNGQRPIQILLPSEARPEFRYFLECMMDPMAKEPRIIDV